MAATVPDTEAVKDATEEIKAWYEGFIGNGDLSDIAMRVLKIVLIFMACLVVKRLLLASFTKILSKTRMEKGLQNFLRSLCNVVLWLLTVIFVATALKIDITPMIAAFSILGLALTLAVQDSLSNLAGGINILMSRPFIVGDYIEIDQDGGTVYELGMIHTTLQTVDNRRIMLPNSKVMSARVINFSSEEQRRVDISFSVSYDAPIKQVQGAILAMIFAQEKTLQDPVPTVLVKEYGESAIAYTMRVWCGRDDYWDLYFDLLGGIKPALDAAGIEMTYPHLNVHLSGATPAGPR